MKKSVFKFQKVGKDSYYAPGDKKLGISNILIFPAAEGSQLELDFLEDFDKSDYVEVKRWAPEVILKDKKAS